MRIAWKNKDGIISRATLLHHARLHIGLAYIHVRHGLFFHVRTLMLSHAHEPFLHTATCEANDARNLRFYVTLTVQFLANPLSISEDA